ncbi:MAG: acyltransferase family protein [Hyphomicrobiales bacterium]
MRLSAFTHGRDNNFNLIRIVAAYAVLVIHSFPLAVGSGAAVPFRDILGMTIGDIAVDVFFITSGFLVTASLLTRQSAIEFVWARVLRIFPALLAMLLLTVVGLGLFFTELSGSSYLTDPKLYRYFFKSLTLFSGVEYELPGVFENNPYKSAVNGSLWTMPFEVKMYAALAIIWMLLRTIPKFRVRAFKVAILAGVCLAGVLHVLAHFNLIGGGHAFRLSFMFFGGASLFVLKGRIVLSGFTFSLFVLALAMAVFNPHAFFIVYTATLAYILIYVAYVPGGYIRRYNKLGDYSYGVYIYAFPVQQSTAALIPGVSVLSMVMISSVVTLAFAVLSWHLLEKHALKLKGQYVHHTERMLSYRLTNASAR